MYTDNELPDYIMVMLVNKKTFHQISNDLQLFLGDHTHKFIEWLQRAMAAGDLTTAVGKNGKTGEKTILCRGLSLSRSKIVRVNFDPKRRESLGMRLVRKCNRVCTALLDAYVHAGFLASVRI